MPMMRLPIVRYYKYPGPKLIKQDVLMQNIDKSTKQKHRMGPAVMQGLTAFNGNKQSPYYLQHPFTKVGNTIFCKVYLFWG